MGEAGAPVYAVDGESFGGMGAVVQEEGERERYHGSTSPA
jgi:hypothetical protein